jgi:hypothetical protein
MTACALVPARIGGLEIISEGVSWIQLAQDRDR